MEVDLDQIKNFFRETKREYLYPVFDYARGQVEYVSDQAEEQFQHFSAQVKEHVGPVCDQAAEYWAHFLELLWHYLEDAWAQLEPILGPIWARLSVYLMPVVQYAKERQEFALPIVWWTLAVATALLWIVKLWEWTDQTKSFPKKMAKRMSEANVSVGLAKIQEEVPDEEAVKSEGTVLKPIKWNEFELQSIETISYNTKAFRFKLPGSKTKLGIPMGRHVSVRAVVDGETVVRPYTPTSTPDTEGYFELVIKMYEMGKMSRYFHGLCVGDRVDIRGPVGRFKYVKNSFEELILVGAGSGITPLLQVARTILEDKEDNTKVKLIYQNRCDEDILLKDTLDALAFANRDRFSIRYCLSKPCNTFGKTAAEHRGYCDSELIRAFLSKNAGRKYAMLCGPEGFNKGMKEELVRAGIGEADVYVF